MSDDEQPCKCPPPGLAPWMGTFADLMALLMCFFVLLLSFSELDAMKFKRLAGSMAQAFGVQNRLQVVEVPKGTSIIAQEFSPGRPEPTPINEIYQRTEDVTEMSLESRQTEEFDVEAGEEGLEAGARPELITELEQMIKATEEHATELAEALSEQIAAGEVEVETAGREIIIRIREKGSFASGSAELNPAYASVLRDVRNVLLTKPGKILVEGHTDNIPISTGRFRSNWELSTSRAVSVAHELLEGGYLDAERVQVSGFADTQPLDSNETPEGRARNRRVEIVIEQGLGEELQEDLEVLKLEDPEAYRMLEEEFQFELKPSEIF